jgi:hypothetical protein
MLMEENDAMMRLVITVMVVIVIMGPQYMYRHPDALYCVDRAAGVSC